MYALLLLLLLASLAHIQQANTKSVLSASTAVSMKKARIFNLMKYSIVRNESTNKNYNKKKVDVDEACHGT